MKNVLIVYSSWTGATHEVAEEIGKVIEENSFKVTVIEAGNSINVGEYDAYIIGTSIHAGQTGRSFRKFIKKNIILLVEKPTALFVVCANMMNDTEKSRQETLTWLNNSINKFESFKPISIGLFGGAFLTEGKDFDKLNFFIRKMIIGMSKKIKEDHEQSDFRDWKSIRLWSTDLIKSISK